MLQNAYFLAKIGADTAENEQHFAEILPTDARGLGGHQPHLHTHACAGTQNHPSRLDEGIVLRMCSKYPMSSHMFLKVERRTQWYFSDTGSVASRWRFSAKEKDCYLDV